MTNTPRPVSPPDLYCITDPDLVPMGVEEQVQHFVAGGAHLIQLRHKSATTSAFRLLAAKCLTICHWGGATFIVNDRVEVAAEIGADGVHLGQDDMAPERAREILGEDRVIGLSTHSLDQFRAALDAPVDYIALGPVFPTSTKKNPEPTVGVELARRAAELLEGDHRPLVLIGGINLSNLAEVQAAAPRAFVASIGGVLLYPDVEARVREWRRAIRAGE